MSEASPSRQSIHHNAPIRHNEDFVAEFAKSMNLSIDRTRDMLMEIQRLEQAAAPPSPPPPAPAQLADKLEALIASTQQLSRTMYNLEADNMRLGHKLEDVAEENKKLRKELNNLKSQSYNNIVKQNARNATAEGRTKESENRLDKIEELLHGDNGMPKIEDDVALLYEYCNVSVNRIYPECQDLNEVREHWQTFNRLPPSLTRPSNPSLFHMGGMAGALPAFQSNNTPMGQNMMPQQQQKQQMVPQQHPMMQQFSNPPMMQQQVPQQQQQQQQYGMNMMPYMGHGGMPPHYQ
ncbi:hypothetical protein KC343_g524 [Hortaea werneckii]|nr:hypothetical protein KC338_g5719 [Hortaea werneckii]KAI7291167.1 hypothetical protein KC352_g2840 [Hortaea werneckii]KAI7572845.1 hypothetical protein KC317_g396 [Hortaea werneckii]KAI7628291.1 hypothetical protein KC346_g266 [Hortaea werneckii]KAI7637779.1 hypothetical protein KC343_g524 [Hortaea werneckii]